MYAQVISSVLSYKYLLSKTEFAWSRDFKRLLGEIISVARAIHVPDIVAKLHMEVAYEDGGAGLALRTLFQRHRRGVLEDVERGLAEHPGLRVIARHHSHADAQVAVATEHVHGTTESRSLRSAGAYLSADQQNEHQCQEEESRA